MSLPRGRIASTRYPVPMNPLPGHAAPTVHFPSRLSAIAAALGTLLLLGQMGGAQSAPPPGQTIRVDTQLVLLDALVQKEILERFDHTNLNLTDDFSATVPSTENLIVRIYELLHDRLGSVTLDQVVVEETGNNTFQYGGQKEILD